MTHTYIFFTWDHKWLFSGDAAATASSLAITSFDIPLTGSMSAGVTIGFIKG